MGIEKTPERKDPRPADSAESRGALNRRDVLKAVSAVPAALIPLASAKGAGHMATPKTSPVSASQVAGSYKPKTLTEHEWETVRVLSDLILPADERSGSATQAGVPEFIDDWLGFRGGTLLAEIRGGLTWLDMECHRLFSRDFAACSPAEQKQILDRIAYPRKAAPADANAVAFFNKLRDLVVSGFYTSEMGIKDLPYLGNKRVAEWKGCPPEVLARLHVKYEDS
jgi:gluconate 2-dehydrogenase gamma chain